MSGRKWYRCSACGLLRYPENRAPGEGVRVRPCPEHPEAEIIEHDRTLQMPLTYFHQRMYQGRPGATLAELRAECEAEDAHPNSRLALLYIERWGFLPERGRPDPSLRREPVASGRGLFS